MKKFISDILAKANLGVEQNAYVLGTVGIGTASPSYLLHVNGTSYFNGNMGINGEGSGVTVDTGYGNNGRVGFMKYGGYEGMLVAGNATLLRLGHRTDSTLVAGGTPTIREDLTITAAGNVGIGTTNPLAKLWIEGNDITLNTEGSSLAKTLYFRYSNGAAVNADSYLTFGTGGSPTEKMRITSDGNIGIGTTSPSTKLDVSGVISATGGNSTNWNTAYSWGNHASGGYQAAATAITTSNIGSQSVAYAGTAGSATLAGYVNNQTGQLASYDNRIISPSETNASYLQFGFTSWANNNSAPYADYLHLRSYPDSSGGSDNLVMFLKSGIGMRIYQQTFGSASAYSSYADVWHTGNLTNLNQLTNGPGYITSYSETDTLASVTGRGASTSTNITLSSTGNQFNGHHYFLAYDANGNHYPHYNAGSNANGSKLNLRMFDSSGNAVVFFLNGNDKSIQWNGYTIYHAGNIPTWNQNTTGSAGSLSSMNISQFTNNSGYITGYTETDTLASVTGRGATTNTSITVGPDLTVQADGSVNYTAARLWLNSHNNYRGAGVHMSGVASTWFAGTPYTDFDGGYVIARTGTTNDVSSAQYSNALLTVKSSGNIGIGTSSPSYKLHVNGTAYINETLYVNQATTIEDTFTVKTQNGSYNVAVIDYSGTAGGRIKVYTDGILRSQIGSYYGDDTFFNAGYGGNVGIGTSSPSSALEVIGTIRNKNASANSNYSQLSTTEATLTLSTYSINTGSYPANIIFSPASTEAMRINTAGYVGIGTTSPANKLVVTSDASPTNENTYAIAAASASDPAYKTIIGYDYTNDIGLIAAVRTGIGWRNLSIPQGSLGIGTYSPAYKLDVSGNSRTTGIHYVDTYLVTPYIYGGGPITMGNDVTITSATAWNASAARLNVGGTGDGRIQVRHIYGKSSASIAADHLWLQYQNTGSHVQIGDSGGGNHLYVSGNIYMGGYFGGNLVATQSWVNSQGFLTSVSDIWVNTAGDTMTGALTIQGGWASTILDGDNVVLRKPNYSSGGWARTLLNFQEYDTTSLFQIGGYGSNNTMTYGYLGSAYNTPTIKWYANKDVAFSGKIIIDDAADNNRYQKGGSFLNLRDPYNNIHLYNNGSGVYVDSPVHYFRSQAADYWMTLNSTGLGIGTQSPQSKLHVEGANDLLTLKMTSGGYNALTLSTTFGGGNNYTINPYITGISNGGFEIKDITNNVSRIAIAPSTGNVGIGTTSPSKLLEVAGDIMAGTSNKIGFRYSGGDSNFYNYITANNANPLTLVGGMWTATEATEGIRFSTYNGAALSILNNGNVGIGTVSPGYKLEVNGSVGGSPVNIARFTSGGAGGGTRGLTMYSDGSQLKLQVSDNVGGIGTWAFLNLNPDGGYVGIGTTSPGYKLDVNGTSRFSQLAYFDAAESINLYGVRGRFTNEYMHLYNKVGVGHPGGWGQGETNTPVYGLSTYGGINIGYGYDGTAVINTYTKINYNYGGGTYGTEAFTIRGTYPSLTLRSTNADNKWLFHSDGSGDLRFYQGSGVDTNSWTNYITFNRSGQIDAIGGNSSQWNTAYGWGNHASASYATTSYVTTQINNLVNGAPGALDTLNELATALGNDASFSTTVTNSIAGKVSKSGDTMTGNLQVNAKVGTLDNQGIYLRGNGDATHKIYFRTSDGGNVWEYNSPIKFEYYNNGVPLTRLTLDTAGNLTIGGFLTESSSIKLKENVETSEGNLEKVVNLRPVTYNKIGSQTTELGLIAEEVVTVYPEFVQYDESGEPVGVNYSRLTAALIGAVKELTQRIETLENNG